MTTKLWTIDEHPGYTIEQTPGAWALWGPCGCEPIPNKECPYCGGTGEKVIKAYPSAGQLFRMVDTELSSKDWRPHRIQ